MNSVLQDGVADFDTRATISRLFVYPVKSCAGVELREAMLTETGLEWDRNWMVVDEQGEFVTQRELPRMALIKPQIKHYEMVLKAPGMLALHIALDAVEQPTRVKVWQDECAAYDMGDVAAQWFTDFLSQDLPPGQRALKLRLVRFDPEHQRASNKKWTQDIVALNQFSDGYPILVISEASLAGLNAKLQAAGHNAAGIERFRPNIVLAGIDEHDEDRLDALYISAAGGSVQLNLVKPCPRCPIPNVNPATGVPSAEVGDMLQTYRQDARVDGALTFGMNAIAVRGIDTVLRVGHIAQGNLRF
jgi:uncharacterized protein